MRLTGLGRCLRKVKYVFEICLAKYGVKMHLKDLGVDGRILKLIYKIYKQGM
jgi:hypothetical protein